MLGYYYLVLKSHHFLEISFVLVPMLLYRQFTEVMVSEICIEQHCWKARWLNMLKSIAPVAIETDKLSTEIPFGFFSVAILSGVLSENEKYKRTKHF